MAQATQNPPGTIEPETLYTLPEIQRRSGLGDWAFRTARRNGLRVIYTGGRGFVRGADFINYLNSLISDGPDEAGIPGRHASRAPGVPQRY